MYFSSLTKKEINMISSWSIENFIDEIERLNDLIKEKDDIIDNRENEIYELKEELNSVQCSLSEK